MEVEKSKLERIKLCRELYHIAQHKGITHEEIAEHTGFSRNNVSRILSGRYAPTLDNLIKLCDAVGYDVKFVNRYLNIEATDEMIEPKFLLSVDAENRELYILHRHYPACLIQIIQEIPMRYVIQDLYEDVENPDDILNMPFVEEAKEFFRTNAGKLNDIN